MNQPNGEVWYALQENQGFKDRPWFTADRCSRIFRMPWRCVQKIRKWFTWDTVMGIDETRRAVWC